MDYKTWIKDLLLESTRGNEKRFIGCTKEEILRLKQSQSVKRLPAIYVELLYLSGKTLSDVIPLCSLCNYKEVIQLKAEAQYIFSEEQITLPVDAFIFYNHLDSQILYFLTETNEDDPVVYEYIEGSGVKILYNHFSEFLLSLKRY